MNAKKKAAGGELEPIRKELAKLQGEVDKGREVIEEKIVVREGYDEQLDRLQDKRKKEYDDRDKLFKQKDELKDAHYAALIAYSKQQSLIRDIEWMKGVKAGLVERQERKDKYEAEKKKQAEKKRLEAEAREQERLDRASKAEERQARAEEDAKHAEENATQAQIDELLALKKRIADDSVAANPLAAEIEQCDALVKFCEKQTGKEVAEEAKGGKAGPAESKPAGLASAAAAGKVLVAPTKGEKEAEGMWASLAGGGKKKGKGRGRKQQATAPDAAGPDFKTVKKFAVLKQSPPTTPAEHEKCIQSLTDLRAALVYWGKITQRQDMVKFIQTSERLKAVDEYKAMAEAEYAFLKEEKEKFVDEEAAKTTGINYEMLKVAQVVAKEAASRAKNANVWGAVDSDASDDEIGAQAEGAKPKKSGKKQAKWTEIAQLTEAFPTLGGEKEEI
jgi:hypothetical protein